MSLVKKLVQQEHMMMGVDNPQTAKCLVFSNDFHDFPWRGWRLVVKTNRLHCDLASIYWIYDSVCTATCCRHILTAKTLGVFQWFWWYLMAAWCCCLLAAACWLLLAGCCLLAAGCWLLAAGCWRLLLLLLAGCCWLPLLYGQAWKLHNKRVCIPKVTTKDAKHHRIMRSKLAKGSKTHHVFLPNQKIDFPHGQGGEPSWLLAGCLLASFPHR